MFSSFAFLCEVRLFFSITLLASTLLLQAQSQDSILFKRIHNEALLRGQCYSRLGELCKTIGPRLSGSDAAENGITWGVNMLNTYGFDSVYTQPVWVPRWERGDKENLWLHSTVFTKELKSGFPADYNCEAFTEQEIKPASKYQLQACVLGGSIGTIGIMKGKIVLINSWSELDSLGKIGALKDKIAFYNRSFDESLLNTFAAYGACVGQRFSGASKAAAYGAKAVLVRSMTNRCDLHPHTGVMGYADTNVKIPAMAVASAVANMLDNLVHKDSDLEVSLELNCRTLPDRLSSNVIAETKGSQFPNHYIAFGGHFDSWDEGEGAHDDGAGCMHAFEALRILKAVGYEPRHSLRCVWWINEENGLRGATEYARLANQNGEVHVAALESDRGGFVPRGFGVDSTLWQHVGQFKSLLEAYNIGALEKGGGGADIGPLKKANAQVGLVSFIPDSQRYFDVHHAETDVFENVNKRELELGAAAVAVMIWILDQKDYPEFAE